MHAKIYEEKSVDTGRTSLILQIIGNGLRKKRSLGLYFKTNPQTESEKRDRKEKRLIADRIANEEEKKLLSGLHLLEPEYRLMEDFIRYGLNFTSSHDVVDKRKYYGVLKKLQKFMGKDVVLCCELTEVVMQRFAKCLEKQLRGESPHNYFSKLKQIINAATEEHYFRKNPATKIRVKQSAYLQKDVLTTEELRKLSQTSISNQQVRDAFILACFTGLRWVDIKLLRWKHVTADTIRLVQAKTKVVVSIPIHDDAVALLGDRGDAEQLVFDLPSHTGALKCLRKWTEAAGIDKHITFHSGRHSYGTALITNGVDVSIASKLLGHTSLVNTQRYVRISEGLKAAAIQKLPSILNQINDAQ